MTKKSFLLRIETLKVIEKMTNVQTGVLFGAILEFVNDSSYIFNNNDELVSDAYKKITSEITEDWSKSYIKNNKVKYHWNWKGGITNNNHAVRQSFEMKKWRRLVFERDKFYCQSCYDKGGELNAHHIKSFANFPNKRFDVNNGITLCRPCHIATHSKKGGQHA